jgi:hypothetical protein
VGAYASGDLCGVCVSVYREGWEGPVPAAAGGVQGDQADRRHRMGLSG